jgi:hypothetical protein
MLADAKEDLTAFASFPEEVVPVAVEVEVAVPA